MAVNEERGKWLATVIAGPARSGKSARIVSLFAESARAGRRPLIIVPDSASAIAMRRRLLSQMSVLPSNAVTTFVALAQRVLALAGLAAEEISAEERELLLRRIVADLAGSGTLQHFAGSTEFDGFYEHLASFIRELKACQIKPADFRNAVLDKTRRDVELAEIYSRYQDALEEGNLYDSEGRFWQARLVLEDPAKLPHLYDEVFLDGFTDFTANELSLLGVFAAHVGPLCVTLPYEDSRRTTLFAKPFDTLKRLRADFAVRLEELPIPEMKTACARIAQYFLAGDDCPKPVPPAGAVRFISTAGVRMEMEEVAREAKRLILEGRKPCEIAVVTRGASAYAAAAREAFASMGVPLAISRGTLGETSQLMALLRLVVDVVESDFDREAVVDLLSSPYVDLAGFAQGPLEPEDVRRLARDAGVIKGFAQWQTRLESLKAALESQLTRDADVEEGDDVVSAAAKDAPLLSTLQNALTRLKNALWPLKSPAPLVSVAEEFLTLLESLGVRRRILASDLPEDVLFRDLAAFVAVTDALNNLRTAKSAPPATSARGLVRMVERLAGPAAASGEVASGGVAFLDVATGRNLTFPVVFLSGLVADAYPAPLPLGPFYSRRERERLARLGLVTRTEESHLAAERLLFYLLLTRAGETLYLTYPSTDERGRPILPSFYLRELDALFSLGTGDRSVFGPSRVLKTLEDSASCQEAAVAAGSLIGAAREPGDVPPLAAVMKAVSPSAPHVLRAAAIEVRRDSFEPSDNFDGLLSTAAARRVKAAFPPGRPWSGTQLTEYRRCPFRFFLSRVLGAERPDEPSAVPTPLERGSLCHEVLAVLFAEIRDKKLLAALLAGKHNELRDTFDSVFERVVGERERRLGLSGDAFWRLEKARLRAMLWRFLEDEALRLQSEAGRYAPAFFELSFGLPAPAAGGDVADRASLSKPVSVTRGRDRETLRGRIDRVDYDTKRQDAAPGAPKRVLILDYKLSYAPTGRDVQAFIDMQMPVYLFAAPSVVPETVPVIPSGALHRVIKTSQGRMNAVSFANAADYENWRKAFTEVFFACVSAVRRGQFTTTPEKGCDEYCIGRGVCRFNENRAEFLDLVETAEDEDA
jgi:ATP-dependent helicase/DNAse subunit B